MSLNLSAQLAPQFTRNVRHRGEKYFWRDQVRIERARRSTPVAAQAVDRTHRIGQQRPVFAYRLIARDTVEEKILELQNSKRDLAAEIIGAESSVIRKARGPRASTFVAFL